ncbi:MAG: SDR family oxidoreductase [Pedobacter sp.]|nr:MAG: SDR family oxidoreductase [Pedobacter sp.]
MEILKRTIVITGASSGVGKAIALAFAEKRERLVLAARNTNELEEVAEECRILGSEAHCITTDMSDYRAVINLASAADLVGNGVDVWINNAGVLAIGDFDEVPMEVNEQVIRTNLLGYMNGAHSILPYFKKRKQGIIINNISIGGFLPVSFGAGYSASKFGIRGFSAALKSELLSYPNIHICDAFPAFLDTPGIQHAANFSGKSIKPAPPVYDPVRIAQSICKIADQPKSETMIGSVSHLLRYSYAIFPKLTRNISHMVIKTYLNRAEPIENTSGNIFNPVKFGNAIYGGWGLPGRPKAHRKYIAGGLLSMAFLGIMMLSKRS